MMLYLMLYVLKSDHVGLLYPFRRFVLRGHFPRPKGEDIAGVTDFAPVNLRAHSREGLTEIAAILFTRE